MLINQLIAAIQDDDWAVVKRAIQRIAVSQNDISPELLSTEFHTQWTSKGHRVREQISNDGLLLDALRNLLPTYTGDGLKLFRGENIDRWKVGACGFLWTPKMDIARMFARGLNGGHGEGGLLLSTEATAGAIITGPNEHSRELGEDEYIVDGRNLTRITVEEYYPINRPSYERPIR